MDWQLPATGPSGRSRIDVTALRLRSCACLGVLVGLFLVLPGCGSDSNTTIDEAPTASQPASTTTTTAAAAPSAKDLFAAKCGSCHTLKAAGTTGTVGPNLDVEKPEKPEILDDIKTGPAVMPANLYTGADAQAVATFIAANEGG
jgi:mono/diheme cytochrome c family protein